MEITVIGAGYAGLTTAACLADWGHTVTCIDIDSTRIDVLLQGRSPLFEPGLDGMLARSTGAGRLTFTDDYDDLAPAADAAVFIVVGTPPQADGTVDLSQLEDAVERLVPRLVDGVTLVVKSTVPVGTARLVRDRITRLRPDLRVLLASNPEFLRQGAAVEDFLEPDRIVIGTDDPAAEAVMRRIYRPLLAGGVEAVFTTLESAELIKYASNAFLATKLSFINEIADLCEASGGQIEDVARGIGLDQRIGHSFLRAGPGFGGSCLPKDTQALLHTSRRFGTGSHIVHAALEVNQARIGRMADKIIKASGTSEDSARVAILGITFKADTDDVRESPSMAIVHELVERGASVAVYDPQGLERARSVLGESVVFAADEYDAASGSDVAVIATEWNQFGSLSLSRLKDAMAQPVLVDLRNLWDPDEVAAAGFRYLSVGRPE